MTNELWAGSRSIVEPYSDYVSIDAVYTPDPAQPIVALPGVLFYHQGPGVFMSIQKLTVDGLRCRDLSVALACGVIYSERKGLNAHSGKGLSIFVVDFGKKVEFCRGGKRREDFVIWVYGFKI
ncbi:hypothetical protein MRB53_027365 [Persea americana]|uniref:Uncharacterized protein n=1 Tax=Persea americana TaxID=3435 RepID=A0ACC2LKS9_PERAE|nr:hypothetical protein MRB53_027365 [Persea americana]